MTANADQPLWQPSADHIASANITAFTTLARTRSGRTLEDYAALHAWSIEAPEDFWRAVWDFGGVIGERGERVLVDGHRMPGAQWFPDARLNFGQNLLRSRDDHDHCFIIRIYSYSCRNERKIIGDKIIPRLA